tara:strand:- start:3658 stop:4206 length:549 start_codon:yes stop_codon:yes gene_type:complete
MPYTNCEIDGGRTVGCKESLGGVKAVYIGNFEDIPAGAAFAQAADVVTAVETQTFYKFELRPELSSLVVNYNSDAASGTTFFEQVLSCTFQLLDSTDVADIRNLCQGRPNIWVEDNNLNVFLIGAEYGCNVTGGNIQTGVAFSDMSGYTIDFTAREQNPVYFASAPTAADALAGVTGATVAA